MHEQWQVPEGSTKNPDLPLRSSTALEESSNFMDCKTKFDCY